MNYAATLSQLVTWVDNRFQLSQLKAMGEKKLVPLHRHSMWYYLGGAVAIMLGIQVVTGILLMFYYIPELKSAHSSILTINTKIDFGWFIRSLHSWGANLAILALFVHMFSAYFMKAYRAPREITWLSGMLLLFLGLGFGFTGYLLPWDEVSFFATKIGLDITSKMPVLGPWVAELLRGGELVGQATLSRFFVIHVIILPVFLLGLMGLHLLMVQLKGMSHPKVFAQLPESKKRYERFFPDFLLKDMLFWLIIVNVLALLVTLSPWGLGPQADPFAPAPIGIKPEWYFMAMFQFLKLLPAQIGPIEGEMAGMGVFAAIALVLLAAPFVDTGRSIWIDRAYTWFGWIVMIGFIGFTVWGALA